MALKDEKDESVEDPALKGIGKRRATSRAKIKEEVKDEPMEEELDIDDLPRKLHFGHDYLKHYPSNFKS